MHQKYFTVQDATGIPRSSVGGPVYYYTVDNTTFQSVNGGDLLMLILNRGVGLVLQPEKAATLIQAFFSEITGATSSGFIEGALYDSNDTFLGYALDNINGLYYSASPVEANEITVPSEMTNNVYNFYEYYILNNPETIPYFNYHCDITTSQILNNYSDNYSSSLQYVQSFLESNYSSTIMSLTYQNSKYTLLGTNNWNYAFVESPNVAVAQSTSDFDSFVIAFNIIDSFNCSSFLPYTSVPNRIVYRLYDSSLNNYITIDDFYYISSSGISSSSGSMNSNYLGYSQYGRYPYFPIGQDMTFYRSLSDYQTINVTQTYTPSTFITDSYNSYSTSNDNSISTSINQISNSVSNNSSSYSSTSSSYYNYVDNGYVDNSSIVTNTTTVINNYYNDDNGGGGGGDDPSNPDTPLDWSDFIELLKHLLEALGAIIVGIFEGLLSLITQVLEAIASIVSNLDGFTEFLSALFGFLPSPVPEVIAAGFSLCILCAVIKFLRG